MLNVPSFHIGDTVEYRIYPPGKSPVSTREFHKDRPGGHHLEQEFHQPRISKAIEFIVATGASPVVDLGCGDGGLLSVIHHLWIKSWGYDFTPQAVEYAVQERRVEAYELDFVTDSAQITWAPVAVITEVLEHLDDPHAFLQVIQPNVRYLVASSPVNETKHIHDPCHAWVWDMLGYKEMIEGAGFTIVRHERVGFFQVVLAQANDAA